MRQRGIYALYEGLPSARPISRVGRMDEFIPLPFVAPNSYQLAHRLFLIFSPGANSYRISSSPLRGGGRHDTSSHGHRAFS